MTYDLDFLSSHVYETSTFGDWAGVAGGIKLYGIPVSVIWMSPVLRV
jgi:hypothetical protein